MIRTLLVVALTGIIYSCNQSNSTSASENQSNSESETITDSTAIAVEKQLVAIDSDQALIATALMAAPQESRAECTVIGYNMAGEFVTLRQGTNQFIVLADDPNKPGFSAACYHKDLEPFMARGRALKAAGKSGSEIFAIREAEAKSGALDMGKQGSTMHIYFGKGELYNPETFEVEGAKYRYVVYMPFATAESTGLPEMPIGPNHPWIMNPGTHRAHIMISPLAND